MEVVSRTLTLDLPKTTAKAMAEKEAKVGLKEAKVGLSQVQEVDGGVASSTVAVATRDLAAAAAVKICPFYLSFFPSAS